MEKIIFYAFLLGLFLVLMGCVSTDNKNDKVTNISYSVTDEEQNFSANVSTTSSGLYNWCNPGDKLTTAGPTGSMVITIVGLTNYKGKQMCNATTFIQNELGNQTLHYYFTKDQKEICWELIDSEGQKFEACTN